MKYRMGEITALEMREILSARPVVLLPLGSFEDQGPHAPMGDYLSAERMAELIAERATSRGTRTLVAPVLAYGGADYFGTAPGGIALGQETFRAVLRDMFGCLLRHDISRLIVVNGHAGNTQAVLDTARVVWRERRLLIPSFYLWKIARGLMPGIVGAEQTRQTSGHGGDPLTSIATHLFPQWMRPDLTPPPHEAPDILGMTGHRIRHRELRGRGDRCADRTVGDHAGCGVRRGCARVLGGDRGEAGGGGDRAGRAVRAALRGEDAVTMVWWHPLPNPPPLRGRGSRPAVHRSLSREAGEGWGGGARIS